MTFFTEDTCYNLALVTVLALVALYLIGRFFTEEEFTVYFQNTDPIDYNKCVEYKANMKGVNRKGKSFCNDFAFPVVNPVKKSYSHTYSSDVNPIAYDDCEYEGGKISINDRRSKKCYINVA